MTTNEHNTPRSAARLKQIDRALAIARTLGTFTAARYLRLRGWSIEAALFILCRPKRSPSWPIGV